MEATERIRAVIRQHLAAVERFASQQLSEILAIAAMLTATLRDGGTIYLCGNGGSAADAEHVAGELIGRFLQNREPWPAMALTTNPAILTAVGNDFHFDEIFARQVSALAKPGDLVVGISTSGKSPNILKAIDTAKARGALTLAFTGEPGEPLASRCDQCFRAPSAHTPRIQELHILAWHILCELVEEALSHADPTKTGRVSRS